MILMANTKSIFYPIFLTTIIFIFIFLAYSEIQGSPEVFDSGKYSIDVKDIGGSSYIHTEVTPQGDIWIYNSLEKEVIFLGNPRVNNEEIKIIKKSIRE
jgi:hypothetical protein